MSNSNAMCALAHMRPLHVLLPSPMLTDALTMKKSGFGKAKEKGGDDALQEKEQEGGQTPVDVTGTL